MNTLSGKIGAHFAAVDYDRIAPGALRVQKRLLLDTLACAWAGSVAPGLPELRRGMRGPGSEASLWGIDGRTNEADAAFLNGASAAALDYDSLHLDAVVHGEIVLLPALLAVAQRERLDGRRFLAQLTAAADLICRLGRATRAHSGWFYTSIHGVFAAAAGCAGLLGLRPEGIRDALGIALFKVGGTQQSMVEKASTKRLMSAFAARDGLFSARLAASGVTAPHQAFEGSFGFYKMYEDGDPASVLQGLGKEWLGEGTSLKKFPSCGCNHAVVEATLQLAREHDLRADDVIGVRAVISHYMNRLVGSPYDPSTSPQVAAQFSVQYSVASALLRRRLAVADIQPEAACDPAAIALARKVEVVLDDSRAGQLAPAEVEIQTRSKGWLRGRCADLPGSPANPMTDAELAAKVKECMQLGETPLSATQIDRLSTRVMDLEKLPDLSRLFEDL